MRSILLAFFVMLSLGSSACFYEPRDCGPGPEPTGAFLSLTRDLYGPPPRVGEKQRVDVSYSANLTAGCGRVGIDSCECSDAVVDEIDRFDVTDVRCDDDACEIVYVGEILNQRTREIGVVLKQPSATLHVHVKHDPRQFVPEMPEADGTIALTAAP